MSVLRAASTIRVMTRLPTECPMLDLLQSVHSGVGGHKASFSVGNVGSFLGGKAARV